ncbi:MAG: hypothetical protein ACR2NN_01150 [Bryobacteraceae bacterium]
MQWLRLGTLCVCVSIGLSVLALVIHTFWFVPESNPSLLGQRVQDLQLLIIILLGLAGLYTMVFLLAPSMSEQILKEQTGQTVKAVQSQLTASAGEFRELRDEIRDMILGQGNATGKAPAAVVSTARAALTAPKSAAIAKSTNSSEYLHLLGRLRVLNHELAQIYKALAAFCIPQDFTAAKTYLNQALGLIADPAAAAEIHYDLACLLARQGKLGEAVIELQTAFMNKSPELERKLAKDTEEGGPLYELAVERPYDRILDELLMDVSVGASAPR